MKPALSRRVPVGKFGRPPANPALFGTQGLLRPFMTHTAQLLAFLEDIGPEGQCDDCLSASLRIEPRQTVNQICIRLSETADIERSSRRCARCSKHKLVNSYRVVASRPFLCGWNGTRTMNRGGVRGGPNITLRLPTLTPALSRRGGCRKSPRAAATLAVSGFGPETRCASG